MHAEESQSSPYVIPAEEWGPGYRLWERAVALLSQRGPDGTTSLVRIASHLMIILVAALVIGISRLELPGWEIAAIDASPEVVADETTSTVPQARPSTLQALVRAAPPVTLFAERPRSLEITSYTVQPGDTLYGIADQFRVSAETLMWANNMELDPDLLRLGQELKIPPVDGVLHTVVQGDTVDSIAKKYKANPPDIIGFATNKIDSKNPVLTVGKLVIVPGGSKAQVARPVQQYYTAQAKAPANAPQGGGRFAWPTHGQITTGFRAYHYAIDIATSYGTPVRASDAGYVASVIYSKVGYGYHVIVDHGNGYQTLYAHLSKISVPAGATVEQGTVIGAVGSTGHSTGPHLHFEIHLNGAARNPFGYLP